MDSNAPRLSAGNAPAPSWLRSKYGIMALGSVVVLAKTFLPITFLKDMLVEYNTLKRDGKTVPLDTRLSEILKQALTHLNFPDSCKPQGFTTTSFGVLSVGSVHTMFGGSIGIPEYFKISTVEEARSYNFQPLEFYPDREDVLSVKETLLLSEKAKLYAIAREAARLRNLDVFLQVLYPPLCFSLTIPVVVWLEKQLSLRKIGRYRTVFLSIVLFYGMVFYDLVSDFTTYTFDIRAEEEVCKLGKSYIDGGLEYNEKCMLRNRRMLQLPGYNVKDSISENGDANTSKSRLKYSDRLQLIQAHVERN